MQTPRHQTPSHEALITALTEGNLPSLHALLAAGCSANCRDSLHRPALCLAARLGQADAVRALLAAGASLGTPSRSGKTPLYYAAATGQEEVFSLLLAAGASRNSVAKNGATLLHAAAQGGSAAILSQLLESNPQELNARQHNGDTPLMTALQHNQLDAIRLLLEYGANPLLRDRRRRECSQLARSAEARNLLAEALKSIYAELPRKLAFHAPNVEDKPSGQKKHPDLEYAVSTNNVEAVRLALAGKHEPLSAYNDYDDWSLLHTAASHGCTDIVRLLLKAGANPNAHTYWTEETPLHLAAFRGDAETIRVLLDAGAQLEAELVDYDERYDGDDGSETALDIAVARGHCNAVRVLLRAGANYHRCNSMGYTPLLRALANGQMTLAMEIATLSPETLNAANSEGLTPLITCVRHREVDALRHLLELGADPDALSANGNTALHEAILSGFEAAVDLLLSGGASIDISNHAGEQPLHIAAKRGDVETARALLLLGANAQARNAAGRSALELATRPALRALLGG